MDALEVLEKCLPFTDGWGEAHVSQTALRLCCAELSAAREAVNAPVDGDDDNPEFSDGFRGALYVVKCKMEAARNEP